MSGSSPEASTSSPLTKKTKRDSTARSIYMSQRKGEKRGSERSRLGIAFCMYLLIKREKPVRMTIAFAIAKTRVPALSDGSARSRRSFGADASV